LPPVSMPTPSDPARTQFAPIYVSPQMQWAVPNGSAAGPAGGALPGYGAPSGYFGGGPASPTTTASQPGNATTATIRERARMFHESIITNQAPYTGRDEEAEETSTRSPRDLNSHSGKAGVDLAEKLAELRNQDQVTRATVRQVAGRTCLKLGSVWIDQGA